MSSWEILGKAIQERRSKGDPLYFWLRDDDAYEDSERLQSLLQITEKYSIPVAWSVIPLKLQPSLVKALKGRNLSTVIQHGLQHHNFGKGTGLSGEFQEHRPLNDMVNDLKRGRNILEQNFSNQFLPIFVPPWNQIANSVILELPKLGYLGLSRFGDEIESQQKALPLKIENCFLDLLKWKPTTHFAGKEKCLSILTERVTKGSKSIGILTHHLDHEKEASSFLMDLILFLHEQNCQWKSVKEVFQIPNED